MRDNGIVFVSICHVCVIVLDTGKCNNEEKNLFITNPPSYVKERSDRETNIPDVTSQTCTSPPVDMKMESSSCASASSADLAKASQNDLHRKDKSKTQDQGNSWAVVVYDDSVVSPFHKSARNFSFVGKSITIRQEWQKLGVAAVVWDAALVLCQYLEGHPSLVNGKQVLELGAGSGIVGMVAALLGAKTTITDRAIAIPYINKVMEDNSALLSDKNYKVMELDWTKNYDCEKYDIILGADIVYIEETFPALLATLKCFSGTGTKIFLSCKHRYDRDDRFMKSLADIFIVKQIHFDVYAGVALFQAKKRES